MNKLYKDYLQLEKWVIKANECKRLGDNDGKTETKTFPSKCDNKITEVWLKT